MRATFTVVMAYILAFFAGILVLSGDTVFRLSGFLVLCVAGAFAWRAYVERRSRR